uniref:hypothetical protein n=1 Tax=Enterocloster clostridioformis TaxID=1531 RepID=UPI0025A58E03|nr:hypothetical protein [Enterocloster clostridioformis]
MDRDRELAAYVNEYRKERMRIKTNILDNNISKLLPEFYSKLDSLIFEQVTKQKEKLQGVIENLLFCRLISSGYTGSFELALGLSNSMLFQDDNIIYVYWTPKVIYDSIQSDMQDIEKELHKEFVQLEVYELFRLKQKLLLDDWRIFCNAIDKLVEATPDRFINSHLLYDKDIQVLCGNYMGPLDFICTIRADEEG